MALLLMVGFYLLAVGVSAALLWIPYAEYVYLERVDRKIALACIGGAAAILWALLPRADKFTPPGPHLAKTDAPDLFEITERVARTTGPEMPADVFLCTDDAIAREAVAGLAAEIGFRPLDLGPLRNARVAEHVAVAWIHLAMKAGLGRDIAFKVVGS